MYTATHVFMGLSISTLHLKSLFRWTAPLTPGSHLQVSVNSESNVNKIMSACSMYTESDVFRYYLCKNSRSKNWVISSGQVHMLKLGEISPFRYFSGKTKQNPLSPEMPRKHESKLKMLNV